MFAGAVWVWDESGTRVQSLSAAGDVWIRSGIVARNKGLFAGRVYAAVLSLYYVDYTLA
jgi:hypothetical protein